MRIYHSSGSDLVILDSVSGLNDLHARLRSFLVSDQRTVRLAAVTSGSPEPYDELLPTLEVEKTEGPIHASISAERVLRIAGDPENLAVYVEHFRFRDDEDGAHHHPEHVRRECYIEKGSMSVIIEAGTVHIEDLRRGS